MPPTPLNQYGVNVYDEKFAELYQLESQLEAKTTAAADDKAEAEVTLVDEDGNLYKLGPTLLTGKAVETATANLGQDGQWTVNPVFRAGADGIDKFNEAAAKCFSGAPECPAQAGGKGRLAIVLDSEVLSAPSINESNFARDQIQISGSFTEDEAKNLAVALRFGSLPVELQAQQAETVSATLGQDALTAGLIAGGIGLLLVCAYLLLYYRLLGLVTIGSLSISASLLWVIMSNLNATVTLAGVVGIVVSIGISLDSSIVFFESLKEDVRNGASLRTVRRPVVLHRLRHHRQGGHVLADRCRRPVLAVGRSGAGVRLLPGRGHPVGPGLRLLLPATRRGGAVPVQPGRAPEAVRDTHGRPSRTRGPDTGLRTGARRFLQRRHRGGRGLRWACSDSSTAARTTSTSPGSGGGWASSPPCW